MTHEDIRTYFEAEAKELIDRLTRGIAALGAEGDQAAIADMLRAAHTLKGAAHVVGERRMAGLAHDFEDGLATYRSEPSQAHAETLLRLADGLAAELNGAAKVPEQAAEPSQAAAEPEPDLLPAATPAPPITAENVAPRQRQTVRVDVRDARRLLDGLSGSGLRISGVAASLARLEELEGKGTPEMRRVQRADLRRDMGEELDRLAREMVEMHRLASQLRLSTAESLLLDAGRVVRASAAAQGRQVRCLTLGGDERIEVPILDAMADALLHLVRNAVAHGIEPAAERVAAGKPAIATIRVEVARRGTDAVFTCADDGRGIRLEPIRAMAVKRGELTEAQARGAPAAELLALLLQPGFSLSQAVDQLSGRGVGLDAVREAAARVGGRVEIESNSEPGADQGTTFRVIAPQTLFAIRSLEVEAGGRRFEIPVGQVEQTLRLDPHLRESVGRTQTLLVGRETMSFAWLNDAFQGSTGERGSRSSRGSASCLVLAEGSRRMVLGVDRMVGLNEILVQPLPRFAGVAGFIAGTSMGPDGVPRPVIDVAGLMRFVAGADSSRTIAEPGAIGQQSQREALPILVIDDSLTTRMLEQSILEAEGYEVELATSAEQGLAMARAKPYALFLVDVEMPGMNGFEFVATVTADEDLRRTPAILVTSLDSPESRERGRAAGAYSYIVKGEFDQAIYLNRIRAASGGSA